MTGGGNLEIYIQNLYTQNKEKFDTDKKSLTDDTDALITHLICLIGPLKGMKILCKQIIR